MDQRGFSWFLTYPQVNIPEEDFHDAVWQNKHIAECSGFVIAREDHAIAGAHYHLLICWKRSKRIRSLSAFDLKHNGTTIHGNYQVVRNLRDVYKYVTKDGNYIEDISAVTGLYGRDEASHWELALQAANKEEAFDIIRKSCPREYVLNYRNLEYCFDKHFEVREELAPPSYSRATFGNVPVELDQWVWDNLAGDNDRPQSLFLIGPSRTGKTSWARSLGEHIYCMSSLVPSALKNKSKEVEFIIFDDIEQSTLDKSQLGSKWRSYVGCQKYVTVDEKYKPTETINWGIPSIWCLNKMLNFSDLDFLNVNAQIIYINNKLY